MIDWPSVIIACVWLTGLSLLLSAVSMRAYSQGSGVRDQGSVSAFDLGSLNWAYIGASLFCLGAALARPSWLEKLGWTLLGVSVLVTKGLRPTMDDGRWMMGVRIAPGLPPSSIVHRPSSIWERLVQTELLWLALACPLFFLQPRGYVFVALLFPVLWGARWVARGRFVPSTPLDRAIGLLMVMMLVSLLVTYDAAVSQGAVASLLLGIALYYGLAEWLSGSTRLYWGAGVYLFLGIPLSVAGILGTNWLYKIPGLSQLTDHLPMVLRGFSAEGTGFSPNIVAGALLWFVLPLCALTGWAWFGGRGSEGTAGSPAWVLRFALSIALLVTGGTLALTQSRGALIGAAVALLFLGWLMLSRLRLILALTAAGLVAGLVIAAVAAGPGLMPGGPEPVGAAALGPAADPANLKVRLEIWSRAIYGIEDFPLTGMGMNTFRYMMPAMYPLTPLGAEHHIDHAHNQLLQAALDLGLPGLVSFLSIWIVAAALAVSAWRRARDGWLRALVAGIGASLLASFLFGLTDSIVMVAKPGVIFWVLLALLVAAWQQSLRDSREC